MTTFDERERAYEKKFAMDQEKQFRVAARRNRLLGEWAAARLGFSGPAAEGYVKIVVKSDLSAAGDGAYHKVKEDLQVRGVVVSDSELQSKMSNFLRIAVQQIESALVAQSG